MKKWISIDGFCSGRELIKMDAVTTVSQIRNQIIFLKENLNLTISIGDFCDDDSMRAAHDIMDKIDRFQCLEDSVLLKISKKYHGSVVEHSVKVYKKYKVQNILNKDLIAIESNTYNLDTIESVNNTNVTRFES